VGFGSGCRADTANGAPVSDFRSANFKTRLYTAGKTNNVKAVKQAVICMAVSQLGEGISDKLIRENAERLGKSLVDRSVHTH